MIRFLSIGSTPLKSFSAISLPITATGRLSCISCAAKGRPAVSL